MTNKVQTYGGEIEKPVADTLSGQAACVSQEYFRNLGQFAKERHSFESFYHSDIKPDVIIGAVSRDLGQQGLDNGFNLVETALPYADSLGTLSEKMDLDLATCQKALAGEGKTLFNLSIHPLGKRDYETYRITVAPKGVYPFIWFRGWDHTAGIDARAQNSPATGVTPDDAASAVTLIIGAGAAMIALFANSPYEEGKRSVYKESRCDMWPRMMKFAKVAGDRRTARFPDAPFASLAQYFTWMFGGDTGIHFVLAPGGDSHGGYKSIGDRVLIVEGNPPVLEYLSKPTWNAYYLRSVTHNFPPGETVVLTPDISHMETMQYAHFAGARIRYGLRHDGFPVREFVASTSGPPGETESIFREYSDFVYIEGRDPGANFPDTELLAAGADIARSAVIAPSAVQAGLLNNLDKASSYISGFPWKALGELRSCAIRDGLEGQTGHMRTYEFARDIVSLASEGLSASQQWMLSYPRWVLEKRKNGADRAIDFVSGQSGGLRDALAALVKHRSVIIG